MNIILKTKKYLKYIDQGIYSLSTLLLSLLAPLFFSDQVSAEILYLISFLLLFLAATSAIFVTQILSTHDEDGFLLSKIFTIFVWTSILAFTATFLLDSLFTISYIYFFYFSYVFCTVDFLRRLFIRQRKDNCSLYLSVFSLITIPLSYFVASTFNMELWKTAFILLSLIVSPFYYIYFKLFWIKPTFESSFTIKFIKNAILALLSFGIAWAATQGIFVILYDQVGNTIFVKQKIIFSILGFFNVIMIVQENKYQPLYSHALKTGLTDSVIHLDKSVNLESHLLLILCLFISMIFYVVDSDLFLSFFIFSIYRYIFGLSKKYVYYLRADDKYQFLVISNLLSVLSLGGIYLIIGKYLNTDIVIPLFFIIHSSVFLMTISFLKSRSYYA